MNDSSQPPVPPAPRAQATSFWGRHGREIMIVAILAFAIHDIFGAHGFLAMRRTQKEMEHLQTDLTRLQKENSGLSTNVQSLKTDPKTIEHIARDMGMAKPGETIFKLPAPADGSSTAPNSPDPNSR